MVIMRTKIFSLIAAFLFCLPMLATNVMCVKQKDGKVVRYDVDDVFNINYDEIDVLDESETPLKFKVVDGYAQVVKDDSYKDLDSVLIPENVKIDGEIYPVKSIGDSAFYWCENLIKIDIPSSIIRYGNYSFANCKSLSSIEIPKITYIPKNAFSGCVALADIKIPSSVMTIGESAFSGCDGLTKIEIPSNVKIIEKAAFVGCAGLKRVDFSDGLESIGTSCFSACPALETVEIPASVKTIDQSAFALCTNLSVIVYNSEKNVAIGDLAFLGCKEVVYKLGNYYYVDLGLTSGIKWATCNIGASKRNEYGDYFSWAEVKPKDTYDYQSFTYKRDRKYLRSEGVIDFSNNLTSEYDAAEQNWGEGWRMPNDTVFQELIDECDWTWLSLGGVNGYKVSSKKIGNNNWIFLPAAGYMEENVNLLPNVYASYWSSTYEDAENANRAFQLQFTQTENDVKVEGRGTWQGCPVRPVTDK